MTDSLPLSASLDTDKISTWWRRLENCIDKEERKTNLFNWCILILIVQKNSAHLVQITFEAHPDLTPCSLREGTAAGV